MSEHAEGNYLFFFIKWTKEPFPFLLWVNEADYKLNTLPFKWGCPDLGTLSKEGRDSHFSKIDNPYFQTLRFTSVETGVGAEQMVFTFYEDRACY